MAVNSSEIKQKKGFSLIEVVVVLGVLAFILPAVFAIVFSVLKQQIKVYQLTEIKRQGDSILNTIQTYMKPAYGIYGTYDPATGFFSNELCKTAGSNSTSIDGTSMYFKDSKDVEYRVFRDITNRMMFETNGVASPLSNINKVNISSYSIKCTKITSSSPTILIINYVVDYKTAQSASDSLTYRSRIVVRNN